MRLVIIESPYAGDVGANVEYARRCVRDSLGRGEAPIASHLLYTQPGILNDDIPRERQWGIDAGLAWRSVAQATVVYMDRGMSKGMGYGIRAANDAGIPVEYRWLDDAGTTRKNSTTASPGRPVEGAKAGLHGSVRTDANWLLQAAAEGTDVADQKIASSVMTTEEINRNTAEG